ncbi:MAG TPA: acyl-ACP thioesterase domain-containing protein [Candidatus Limnocylindrales bacterium]|nr:acyl-ACP thioesterase domain-containing protein [Candidatus Limnocylindrales bacterium]
MAEPWIDVDYRVRFDEAGSDGRIHASVLLAWAQDAAWVHSTSLGFDRAWYARHGLTWLVRGAEVVVVDAPSYGDGVVVRTEIVGYRRVLARRLTTCRSPGDETLARIVTDWALVDERGRPVRIPEDFGRLVCVPSFDPIDVPSRGEDEPIGNVALAVRARDVDPLGHANNAAYIDYVDEALHRAGVHDVGRASRTYRLIYRRPALGGTTLSVAVFRQREGALLALRDEAGAEIARASLTDD